MISRHAMLESVLEASPGFAQTWDEFVSEWRHEPELPLYLVLGDLARHIFRLYQGGSEPELLAIFAVVEMWLMEGDPYVKEAASVGLLENLQNATVVAPVDPSRFRRYLGPESKRWWNRVERFWKDGETPPGD